MNAKETAPSLLDRFAASRLYWEDLPVGLRVVTGGRTITESDVVSFAGLTSDFNRLHTDREFASTSFFKERVAHGMLVASISVGLATRNMLHVLMEHTQIAVIENQIKFLKPTFLNDTINVEIEVIGQRETRNPERGVTTFRRVVRNQHREAVIESTVVYLMLKHEGTYV